MISGGGAKGAFAVGAIRYIYERFRHDGWFSIVGGSSTGALIAPLAALLAAPPRIAEQTLATLVESYSSLSSEDILDKKSLFELLRRRDSLSESGRLEALIERCLRPEWFDWLRGPGAPECYVVYTNFQDGRRVTVCPRDPGMDLPRWRKSVLASASVPVLMQGTVIDGEVCYDGGVRDILPFERAIQLGAQTVVPIFLDPEVMGRSESDFRRIDKVLLRAIGILVDETMRNDYQLAHLVSLGVAAREEIAAALAGNDAALSAVRAVLARREYRELFGADKQVSRIVPGLRPERCLTHQLLRFDPLQMKQWMAWGYRRAAEVLPESPFLAAPSPLAPPARARRAAFSPWAQPPRGR